MKQISLVDKAFILKKTPLFKMLDLDLLLIIAEKVGTIGFHPGDCIFDVGEMASRMYFIIKGSIEIYNGDKTLLATLEAPDFFGDEALLSDQPRGYRALCKTESTLLTLSKTNLLTIISECPQVAVGLLQAYTFYNTYRPRKSS